VIFVSVKSLLIGRKVFTPEMMLSKFAPSPASLKRSVSRDDIALKPRKRSLEADGCACWTGPVDIIVIRVISRTLAELSTCEKLRIVGTHCLMYDNGVVSAPIIFSASSKRSISALETSCSMLKNHMMNKRSLSRGSFPLSSDWMNSNI